MKTENGKIVEATEDELFGQFLKGEWWIVMDFREYMNRCEELGTKIVEEETK